MLLYSIYLYEHLITHYSRWRAMIDHERLGYTLAEILCNSRSQSFPTTDARTVRRYNAHPQVIRVEMSRLCGIRLYTHAKQLRRAYSLDYGTV
jgi:hypothetical protein